MVTKNGAELKVMYFGHVRGLRLAGLVISDHYASSSLAGAQAGFPTSRRWPLGKQSYCSC